MPTPRNGESKDEFINRCIPIVINEGTATDPSQAAAICYSKWDQFSLANNEYLVQELLIDEEGINAISLVEHPAIEINYMTFNKQLPMKFAITNEEEQIFTGPALVPDKLIYRISPKGEEYYVFFSTDTVKEIAQRYLINHKQNNVNLEHSIPVDNISIVESWIVKDSNKDKACALGYKDIPVGTWMISMKVQDKSLWEELKNGDFNGFSIEGQFITASKQIEPNWDNLLSDIKEIVNNIND